MRARRRAEVGFVAEQTARVGMSGALKLVNSMSRKFIVRMDREQLLVVAQHIRELGCWRRPKIDPPRAVMPV